VVVGERAGETIAWAGASPYCNEHATPASPRAPSTWRGGRAGAVPAAPLWLLSLCRRHGFREVGVYLRHATLDGLWRDCVIVERLIGEAAR